MQLQDDHSGADVAKPVLVDCGLFQGLKKLRERNWAPFPVKTRDIDAVILTHAHIDHSGYLPLLCKKGFRGSIFSTKATFDLCKILLPDSGFLQEKEAERANHYGYTRHKPALPLYSEDDAGRCLDSLPGALADELEGVAVDPPHGERIPVGIALDGIVLAVEAPARETVLKELSRQRLRTGSVHPDGARQVPRIARMLHDEPAGIGRDEELIP